VLSKLARAQGGVRSHRGFTEKFTAPGGPHLGHHHLPPIPRCRHHTPGAYRPRRAHLRSQRYAQHTSTYARRECLAGGSLARFAASSRQSAQMGDALSPCFSPPGQPKWTTDTHAGCEGSGSIVVLDQIGSTWGFSRLHLGVFTALGPAPGAPHLGHHGRGRGPTCGDHSDAPVRPHSPLCAG
jgi:hypothetical protein